jgi:hypothetical protein
VYKNIGFTIPHIKLYYRAIVTKTAWYWNKNKTLIPVKQNRKPRNKPHGTPSGLCQRSKKKYTREKIMFSKTGVGKTGCLDAYLSPCTNIDSKCTKDLSVRTEIWKTYIPIYAI